MNSCVRIDKTIPLTDLLEMSWTQQNFLFKSRHTTMKNIDLKTLSGIPEWSACHACSQCEVWV